MHIYRSNNIYTFSDAGRVGAALSYQLTWRQFRESRFKFVVLLFVPFLYIGIFIMYGDCSAEKRL